MSDTDALKELLSTLRKMESEGATTVQISALLPFIEHVISEPSRPPLEEELARKAALAEMHIENFRAQQAESLAMQAHEHSAALEMFKTTITAGLTARRDMLWINAGGAVALLALAGHLVASDGAIDAKAFSPALVAFVGGALLAVLTSAFTYASQWGYEKDASSFGRRMGVGAHLCAIGTWIGAGALFVVGALQAAAAFSVLGSSPISG